MSDSPAPLVRSFDTPAVQRYLESRAYVETTKFVHSRNANAFEGVPPNPGETHVWAASGKLCSQVVIGQPLQYQGLQPLWPKWGVCKTPALLRDA
jgi:hypothetical protein